MNSLPAEKVPHLDNPEGIKYHNRQLVYQIPLQDSNFENCRHLSAKQQHLHDAFKRERQEEMATAKVVEATTRKVRAAISLMILFDIFEQFIAAQSFDVGFSFLKRTSSICLILCIVRLFNDHMP